MPQAAVTAAPRVDAPPPEVSVVVIVYDDAQRLPRAVRSVLRQTLRAVEAVVVDDASTDGSYEVARELADAHPGRVRAFRLPRNSGGCGGPRNKGITSARGRYVMFLDSDDELDRNACRNLLRAAERTGADLVTGRTVRVHHHARGPDTTTDWYPGLYRRSRTLDSIAELPDLLACDTLTTNKCYRRDFLLRHRLRFPVGVHYEDLEFSARAYLAARRIAVIPHRVYLWHADDGDGPRRSITSRRAEIRSAADRLAMNRRVDELLLRHGLPEVKLRKDVRFLKHDLVLHLRELPGADSAYRERFAALAEERLAALDPAALTEVSPVHRACVRLLRRRDLTHLLPAVDVLSGARLGSTLDTCAALPGDATDPAGPPVLRLGGTVVDPRGHLTPGARVRGRLELWAPHSGRRPFPVPLTALWPTADGWRWRAELGGRRLPRPVGPVDAMWRVRLVLEVDGRRLTACPRADAGRAAAATAPTGSDEAADRPAVPVRPYLTGLLGDRLQVCRTPTGHLALRLVATRPLPAAVRAGLDRSRGAAAARRAVTTVGGARRRARRLRRGLRRRLGRTLCGGRTKTRVYRLLSRLPARRDLAVFESHLGKQYSDNPRALYEELRRQRVPCRVVWSFADRPPPDFPRDAAWVRRWSWGYLRALARAGYWVDNQGFPPELPKPRGTVYLQTWHGSALKRMGVHTPAHQRLGRAQRERLRRSVRRFDHFLVRGEHDVRTLAAAFELPERTLLRTGYPRNDALVAGRSPEGLRERLGLPPDRAVLLYAPTFRRAGGTPPPLDADRFTACCGDRYVLLLRAHYLERSAAAGGGAVVDVSDQPDIVPLLLLADALVTDYSSVMFDYALLDRPMVFYAPDWEEYAAGRGAYLDLPAEAPGPLVHDQETLFATLADLPAVDRRYAAARRRFAARYGEYDRGDAAARVVRAVFRPLLPEEGR